MSNHVTDQMIANIRREVAEEIATNIEGEAGVATGDSEYMEGFLDATSIAAAIARRVA